MGSTTHKELARRHEGFLALVRASPPRPRSRRRAGRDRRFPEGLSGAPRASAALRGVRGRAHAARGAARRPAQVSRCRRDRGDQGCRRARQLGRDARLARSSGCTPYDRGGLSAPRTRRHGQDRKSTRLNSSHVAISYAVFCLKKKKKTNNQPKLWKITTAIRKTP